MANLRLSENNSSSLDNCRARANYQNLILASKREVKSGSQMWHVYRLSENTKSDEFWLSESKPLSALRYAFLIRKRSGAIIPKSIYNKLMEAVSASKAQAEPSAAQGSAPKAEQASEPSALAKAYESMKARDTDAVLLFRLGEFYVSFADDAKILSEVCGVTLTRRSAKDITAQQAAFPAAELDTWLPKLVRAGKRVAICDTLQSAAPQHSSSKLDSAFGLHACCDEPSAAQESAPKKKATRKRSAKSESK